MKRYFGTDGIRGVANELLTPDFALRLGRAIARYLQQQSSTPRVLIGRDTRRSGAMLETALTSGLCSLGTHVTSAGILPTPAVAYLVREGHYELGIVLSASHNPAQDNGIKLIGSDGYKFPDEAEAAIETLLESEPAPFPYPPATAIGLWRYDEREGEQYLLHLLHLMREWTGEREPLRGIHIAVDCANGAASQFAPTLLAELGAKVSLFACEPDGDNINAGCGSTHLEYLQQAVLQSGAELGVAFDGDADRALFCDENADPVDGDCIMTMWALRRHAAGTLQPPLVVATEMSNLGMERRLQQSGIELVRTQVGDRYVAEAMCQHQALVGGEQSGHIIFREVATTGDGLITLLQTLWLYLQSEQPFSEMAHPFEPFPQRLVSIPVRDKHAWRSDSTVQATIERAQKMLIGRGRLSIRASGTENAIRLMVEAETPELVEECLQMLTDALRRSPFASDVASVQGEG
jgi:phosphoglucosamine mutase